MGTSGTLTSETVWPNGMSILVGLIIDNIGFTAKFALEFFEGDVCDSMQAHQLCHITDIIR